MIPDPLAILAVVVLLLPQAYFLFASPSFLFVSLAIPGVTVLLGVLFGFYLRLLQAAAGFALEDRPPIAQESVDAAAIQILTGIRKPPDKLCRPSIVREISDGRTGP